jgi:hypothetical protein
MMNVRVLERERVTEVASFEVFGCFLMKKKVAFRT